MKYARLNNGELWHDAVMPRLATINDDGEYTFYEVMTERRGQCWVTSVFVGGFSWAGEIDQRRTSCAELAEEQHEQAIADYA